MNKILIFGLPRSGTTVLQKRLGLFLKIEGYSEPFSDCEFRESIGDPYQWVSNLDRGIIKVLSINLDYIDINKLITAGNFDSVIVTKRQNLTDLCVSLFYAEQIANQYHYNTKVNINNISKFNCPLDFVQGWLLTTSWYNQALKNLSNYTIFDYDKYLNNETQIINGVTFSLPIESTYNIDTVSNNIPYNELCLNYNEIKEIIDESRT